MKLVSHREQMADGIDCRLNAHSYVYLLTSPDEIELDERGNHRTTCTANLFLESQHPCLAAVWVHPQADGSYYIEAMEA